MCYECRAEEAKKAPSRTLTRETVMDGDPCDIYRQRFIERFPESVEVTVELALSQSEDWDWYWAAYELLSRKGYYTFADKLYAQQEDAWEEVDVYRGLHEGVRSKAWDECVKECNRLMGTGDSWEDAYDKTRAAYLEKTEVSQAAYEAAQKVVRVRLNKVQAKLWAELYIAEGENKS